jgi:hypothetical protein
VQGAASMPLRQAGIASTEQAVWGRSVSLSTMRLLSNVAHERAPVSSWQTEIERAKEGTGCQRKDVRKALTAAR